MDNTFRAKRYETNGLSSRQSLSDDQSSLVDEGYWHDNDLILAAELGKALLDRNRVLEQALEKARMAEEEKTAEIEFLFKQLTELRELSQRKAAFVDQADSYNMELDRSNRRLMKQMIVDKQKINRLSSHVARLEQQVNNLLDQLNQCRRHCIESQPFSDRPQLNALVIHSPSSPLSASPPRSPVPFDPTSRDSYRRPRSGAEREQFVDDELMDQPQLSFISPTLFHMPWLHSNSLPNDSIHRVTSWPMLSSYTRFNWAFDLATCDPSEFPASKWTALTTHGGRSRPIIPSCLENESLTKTTGNIQTKPDEFMGHCPRCGFSMISSLQDSLNSELRNVHMSKGRVDSNQSTTSATESRKSGTLYATSRPTSQNGSYLRELQDLLDDATFIRRLENIYALKLQCGVPSLTSTDYQPQYKQLFQDAFRMLRDLKRGMSSHQMNPVVVAEEKS